METSNHTQPDNTQPDNHTQPDNTQPIPKIIFIVPYRDRKYQMNIFRMIMKNILEDYSSDYYEIYFAHQNDDRPFNRGAMKNIGFKAVKEKYPNDYQNITFVFNDVDTVPCEKGLLNYETTRGIIKHFYGFKYALGGIFSITGYDFELLNGFPCYWSWGYEDNVLNTRAVKKGLTIDRDVFYKIGDPAILQSVDSFVKIVNRKHKDEMKNDNFTNGLSSINNISFDFVDGLLPINWLININSFDSLHRIDHEHHNNFNLMANKYIGGNLNNSMFQRAQQPQLQPRTPQPQPQHQQQPQLRTPQPQAQPQPQRKPQHANLQLYQEKKKLEKKQQENHKMSYNFNLISNFNGSNNQNASIQPNKVLELEKQKMHQQNKEQKNLQLAQSSKQILLQRQHFIRRGGLAFINK